MIRAIIHTKSVKCNGPSLARLKLCKIEPLKLKLVLFKAETDLNNESFNSIHAFCGTNYPV